MRYASRLVSWLSYSQPLRMIKNLSGRRLIIFMLLLVTTAPVFARNLWPDLSRPPKATGGGERDAAVIVGAENYAFVAKVPGARHNAEDWQSYLTDTLKVPSDRVALLRDNEATLEKLRRFAAQAAAQVGDGGTLWFVFIGHGAPSKDGKDGLLVGADAQQDPDGLYARSLPNNELLGLLSKGKQAKTVVLIDACFSGRSLTGETLVAGLQPLIVMGGQPLGADSRTVLMTAAKSDQFAGPLPKAAQMRPAFSYLALGALRGWAADAHGKVTASAIIDFARRAMALEKGRTQTPELAAGPPGMVLGVGREKAPDLAKIDREAHTLNDEAPAGGYSGTAAKPTQSTPGKAGIEWMRIPGGSFTMGSEDWSDTKPAHRVTVKSFELAKTLVTNKQYKACVEAGACTAAQDYGVTFDDDDQPVVAVDWNQAAAFSKWAGGRLPSEAEWEYAARSAGKDWKYPWGNEGATCGNAVIAGCGYNAPAPVCFKPKGNTAQGLCDMAGNAWEWVQDWYHNSYNGAPSDGSAWENPEVTDRVLRGGSWYNDAGHARSVRRGSHVPGDRYSSCGFRPAR